MKKSKKFLAVLLALILTLSVTVAGMSAMSVSAAEDDSDDLGYSWGTEITVPKRMHVGEVWSFYASGTYNSISNVDCKATTNGVISVSKSGAYITVRALKIGTAKMDVGVDSFYYGPNYSYDAKYDIVHYNITVAAPAPKAATPANVRIKNSGTGIYVSWNKAANAAKYRVYYKRPASSGWSWDTTSSTHMQLTGLHAGEPYYIQVQSINADGVKGGISKAISLTHVRGTTLNSVTYNSNGTITAKWDYASGANGYAVAKKKAGAKNYTYIYVSGTSFTDKNVAAGTRYTYQVRPYYSNGKSAAYAQWSNSKSVTTLYRPTITNMNANTSRLNINWNAVKGAKGFRVAFKRSYDSAWNYRTTTSRYYNVANPTRGATYVVQVCAINGNLSSPYSAAKSSTIAPPLAKPSLTGSTDNSRTYLSWNSMSGATGFQIAKLMTGQSSYTYYTTSSSYYYDYNTTKGKTYAYQVRAYNGYTYGPWSNVITIRPVVDKPTLSLSYSSNKLRATWGKITGASYYVISYKYYRNGTWTDWIEDRTVYGTSFELSYPYTNARYAFGIKAVGENGKSSGWTGNYYINT